MKRQSSVKFLGILIDENLSWKEHLKLTGNKIAKNMGLIYKAKTYWNKNSLVALHVYYKAKTYWNKNSLVALHVYYKAKTYWNKNSLVALHFYYKHKQNLLTKNKQSTKTCSKINT